MKKIKHRCPLCKKIRKDPSREPGNHRDKKKPWVNTPFGRFCGWCAERIVQEVTHQVLAGNSALSQKEKDNAVSKFRNLRVRDTVFGYETLRVEVQASTPEELNDRTVEAISSNTPEGEN